MLTAFFMRRPAYIIRAYSADLRSRHRFRNRRRIVEIPRAARQQEQVLMRLRRAIRDRLGHRVGLVPDDIRSEIPAVRLQREGYAPGDTNEILRLQRRVIVAPRARVCPFRMRRDLGSAERLDLRAAAEVTVTLECALVGRGPAPALRSPRSGITVPQIHPAGAICSQHAPHFAEYADHRGNVLLWCALKP